MATCNRREIHAAIFDSGGCKIAEAVNGPYFGECNCPDQDVSAGEGGPGTLCYGLHAEIVALLKIPKPARSTAYRIHSTKAPCSSCVRILLGSPVQVIAFEIPSKETANQELWENDGRTWATIEDLQKPFPDEDTGQPNA